MKRIPPDIQQVKASAGRPKDAGKREDIVRAASTLFMHDGFERTSMEAVAKKADVSKLTIYSHFADKNELFRDVIGRRCLQMGTPESYAVLEQKPAEKALMELGITYSTLIFSPDAIRLHRVMQAEAPRHPKLVQIFYEAGPKRVREAFGDLLKAWVKQGQLSIPDIPKATEQFFSLIKGEMLMKVLLHRAPPPSESEIKQHVRATVNFFLSGYRPSTKPKR